ncbi:MAG TPA: hypothetical protein VHE09_09670 [Rhizomicrobium sp.]|jgi:hypothetical protein|nr:hypothetical protein [Rhizomicrobium sp.]
MRTWKGVAILAGAAFAAVPACAQTPAPTANTQQITANAPADVPSLMPGDDVAIACDAIERVADPSDVRVVLTIAALPGDTSPGYKKILALNEKVTASSVHLKVPNAPDLANHTVDLSVYVVNGPKNTDCEGGKYRVVQTPLTTGAVPKNPG